MKKTVVEIQNLTFTYQGKTTPTLDGINVKIQSGEFVVITGASGCGKSTLALCMTGFIPYAFPGKMIGSIKIHGKETRDYSAGGLSGIVGLVQQDPEAQLCTLTVMDEVAFGPENLRVPSAEIRQRVEDALQAVGGEKLKNRKVHTLSGGEKQRVAIASVLAMKPSLLILDEPTANLDPHCTVEVLQVLKKLKEEQNVSIIIVEHRLEKLLPLADRLIVMTNGKTIEEKNIQQYEKRYITQKHLSRRLSSPSVQKIISPINGKEMVTPLLSVKDLKVGYEGINIIKGISFNAYPGEVIAIMGDNGSGKTTMILSILGILKATGGSITYKDQSLEGKKISVRAREMGLTFQNPNHQIFEESVIKEATLPLDFLTNKSTAEKNAILEDLLKTFDLWHHKNQNPFTLSLGEKKRLTLVSVLAYAPPILILDEPLVGQDSLRMETLMNTIEKHREGGGLVLMVCHEPSVIQAFCNRMLFLKEGELMIDATVEEGFAKLETKGCYEYIPVKNVAFQQVEV